MIDRIQYTFDAVICLLPTDQGGRRTAVKTNYRPNFNFNTKQYFCGEIRFKNHVESIAPGEYAEATIAMMPARHIPPEIGANYVFIISEGTRAVGVGMIREVLESTIVTEDKGTLV